MAGADGFAHVFTVFTATFNRAHVLHRVYDSLRTQTFRTRTTDSWSKGRSGDFSAPRRCANIRSRSLTASCPNVPELIVWNRIARTYRTRFANDPLRIYHTKSDSITSAPAAAGRNAYSYALGNRIKLNEDIDYLRHAPGEP